MSIAAHLHGLNEAQSRAVQHPPSTPLQILAGPGSGKTRVLTSRIVHLISAHGVQPASICAVTFTNKAANEMRERLGRMLGRRWSRRLRWALSTRYALDTSGDMRHLSGWREISLYAMQTKARRSLASFSNPTSVPLRTEMLR
ncbi:UvrD/REP helicase N-terminal domain-containing protein [Irpex lacteus]|nr:UvrD/REP helicase N-terminal domain-containing protein [Irpex lacteus]